MILTHNGWSKEKGVFRESYVIDTSRSDHEIRWKDGTVCKQLEPFQSVTADWNCDGDVYAEFGANFENKYGSGRSWYTPLDLLGIMLDGEADVPGFKRV